jgi:capsular exopolysaccharide synthesis family protein
MTALTIRDRVAVSEPLPAFEQDVDKSTRARLPRMTSAVLSENGDAVEPFRLLSSRLRALSRQRQLRAIGVVSASPGEGKTTVAIGLARSLALGGQESVLLVDTDLRRPALDKALGLGPTAAGVRQHLEGWTGALSIRRVAAGDGCWVLSAGEGNSTRPDLLASPRMATLIEAARRSFAYVVLDCPPLMTVADAVLLQDYVDGFVLVIRSRHASREAVLRAISLLKPGAIVGTVFNGHHEFIKSYYNRYNRYK